MPNHRYMTGPARLPPALLALCAEELRTRLPALLDSIQKGDRVTARTEAHAMRGVAANFGLAELAEILGQVEAAARDGLLTELSDAALALPTQLDAALQGLLGPGT
jgi:HPt (histidine-containing phosphotransfer) domain-containing protein